MPVQDRRFGLPGFVFHLRGRRLILADIFFPEADAIVGEEGGDFEAPRATGFHIESREIVGHFNSEG